MKTHLVLSGGGVKGVAMIGALSRLQHLCNFTHFAGASVGALISSLLCVCTVDDIVHLLYTTQFSFVQDMCMSLDDMYSNYGLLEPSYILSIVSKQYKTILGIPDPSFQELYEYSSKKLYIVGTNLTKQCGETFRVDHSPHMSVLKAIEISISIPFIFKKVRYNDCVYVDGCVSNMYPDDIFANVPQKTLLKLYTSVDSSCEISSMYSYAYSIIATIIKTQKSVHSDTSVLWLQLADEQDLYEMSHNDIKRLYNKGKRSAQEYLHSCSNE